MKQLSEETTRFIAEHRNDNVRDLALKCGKANHVDMAEAIVQIAGWQIAEKKIPLWANTEGMLYPKHLSMEQCSSETTARYKAALVSGKSFADLTAGFGVDCSFIARNFETAHYVERQEELCEIAENNFHRLGLDHIEVHHADGTDYLQTMAPVDCLFLDPARRDSNGGKTVSIADCEPDVCQLEETLVRKGKTVMIKLSPMLDIFSAIRDLKYIRQIHIVAVNNECKELITVLSKQEINTQQSEDEVIICCEQVVNNSGSQHFDFTYTQERNAQCTYANKLGNYLYEPGAALLKAGAFRLLSERFGTRQLSANSHLYTSANLVDFPGRRFHIEAVSGFSKKELKELLKDVSQANITVRNFPQTVAELRKKLKLKDGGNIYLFATTLYDGSKVLIKCTKA